MKKYMVKLNCGNFAVIQSCGFPQDEHAYARIGVILPGRKVIEFFKLNNWAFSYEGSSQIVKHKLLKIYAKNKASIKKKVVALLSE